MVLNFILFADSILLVMASALWIESMHEREKRATRVGLTGIAIALVIGSLAVGVPGSRLLLASVFGIATILGILFCIPWKQNPKALAGAIGYAVKKVTRFNEADDVFARTRSLPEGSDVYKKYYKDKPEQEIRDHKRREKGILGKIGSVDGGYWPNVALMMSSDEMANSLGPYAESKPSPDRQPFQMSPEKATDYLKKYAEHLGAGLVGVCKTNSNWVYSHRGEIFDGNWEQWGKALDDIPPNALVFLLEMKHEYVMTAPHTPIAAESTINYGKGAFISTMLARWISEMGYQGIAQHPRHYDVILPPLAVDAGLGEVGRNGYLIAPKYGARVRIFAVLTDMPLVPDRPISIGVEEFCKKCLKCASTCPSQAIPKGEMVEWRGVMKWKLDEEACYDYWSRIGTDCGICMAICPFSRPNSYFHRFIRWFVAHTPIAKAVFPHIDNLIYGKKWRPRNTPGWIAYPKRSDVKDVPEYVKDINY